MLRWFGVVGRRHTLMLAVNAIAALASVAYSSRAIVVERIVAVVGDRALLLSDLEQRLRPRLLQFYRNVPEAASRTALLAQLRRELLEAMVDEVLEAQFAARQGLAVSASELENAVELQARQNSITVSELYDEVKANALSPEEYRDELRRQLLSAKVSNLITQGRRPQVRESDLRDAYERLDFEERGTLALRAAGIEIAIRPPGDSAATLRSREQADSVVQRARAGEDFGKLIAEHSSDARARERGGILDATRSNELAEPLDRAVRAAEPGEVVGPVRVGNGWWVLKLLERAPSSLPPFEQAKEQVRQRVQTERFIQARRAWLDGLRRQTHVEVRH
jgi:peptidyl-prolyl cis-trans isomerase SurA